MFGRNLSGHDCPQCGDEALYWYKKDETEDVYEVYLECDACRKHFPKLFVPKEEDTSDSAIIERIENQIL